MRLLQLQHQLHLLLLLALPLLPLLLLLLLRSRPLWRAVLRRLLLQQRMQQHRPPLLQAALAQRLLLPRPWLLPPQSPASLPPHPQDLLHPLRLLRLLSQRHSLRCRPRPRCPA